VRLITDILDNSAKISRMRTNANSIATAKMGAMVASAFGGKGGQVKASDFLPYKVEENDNSIADSTIAAIKWALQTQKIPSSVVAMLGSELA